jgi:hypothetical protein
MGETDILSDENRTIEEFYNYFEGALLVPKDALLNHELVRLKKYPSEWSEEILKERRAWAGVKPPPKQQGFRQ